MPAETAAVPDKSSALARRRRARQTAEPLQSRDNETGRHYAGPSYDVYEQIVRSTDTKQQLKDRTGKSADAGDMLSSGNVTAEDAENQKMIPGSARDSSGSSENPDSSAFQESLENDPVPIEKRADPARTAEFLNQAVPYEPVSRTVRIRGNTIGNPPSSDDTDIRQRTGASQESPRTEDNFLHDDETNPVPIVKRADQAHAAEALRRRAGLSRSVSDTDYTPQDDDSDFVTIVRRGDQAHAAEAIRQRAATPPDYSYSGNRTRIEPSDDPVIIVKRADQAHAAEAFHQRGGTLTGLPETGNSVRKKNPDPVIFTAEAHPAQTGAAPERNVFPQAYSRIQQVPPESSLADSAPHAQRSDQARADEAARRRAGLPQPVPGSGYSHLNSPDLAAASTMRQTDQAHAADAILRRVSVPPTVTDAGPDRNRGESYLIPAEKHPAHTADSTRDGALEPSDSEFSRQPRSNTGKSPVQRSDSASGRRRNNEASANPGAQRKRHASTGTAPVKHSRRSGAGDRHRSASSSTSTWIRRAAVTVLSCIALFSLIMIVRIISRSIRTSHLYNELSEKHTEAATINASNPLIIYSLSDDTAQTDSLSEDTQDIQDMLPSYEAFRSANQSQEAEADSVPSSTPMPAQIVSSTTFHQIGGDALPEMAALYADNSDLVGWLNIKGVLDLPVVYKNNVYYLTHDFHKKNNTSGTIFLDENHPFKSTTQNLLLHGHNMRDGSMFGRLLQYRSNLSFLKKNCIIDFSSLWVHEEYVIFAVLETSLEPSDPSFFNYFTHAKFKTDDSFNNYISQLMIQSIYAIPVDVKPSDPLITLSTCLDDDRLIVVGRRRRENETTHRLRQLVASSVRQ